MRRRVGHNLQLGRSEPHDVARSQLGEAGHARPVHEGAVRRSEILDGEAALLGVDEAGVAARQFDIVGHRAEPRLFTADGQLVVDVQSLACPLASNP